MISFAQNFEDVLLERLFSGKKRGFYVDVGAWDPDRYSVTRHFYDRGWRGVNIEPIKKRHESFTERRSRDINLLRLIGPEKSTRFFECSDADYLSTTVFEVADQLAKAGHDLVQYDVEMETLDAIFDRYCPKIVDFLKIDTEGSEAAILKTIDLGRYRPRALVIESTLPGSGLKSWDEPEAFGTWHEWEATLIEAGYLFAHFDGLNRFYLRREDSKLATRLVLPPGLYDGIDCTDNWQTQAVERLAVIDQQQADLASVREQSAIALADLKLNLDAAEAANAGHSEMNDRLMHQLAAAELDRGERLRLIATHTEELNECRKALVDAERAATMRIEMSEAGRIACDKVIAGLVEQIGAVERDRAARLSLIDRLTTELSKARRALDDAERAAAARIEAVEADRIARGEVIARLVEQIGAVERDRAARLALIERLTVELDESRRLAIDVERALTARVEAANADRVARGEVIRGLEDQLASVERDRAARLNLIERLTLELTESRAIVVENERSAAARLASVEADRVARGDVIDGLVEQLQAAKGDADTQEITINHLKQIADTAEERMMHLEEVIRGCESNIFSIKQNNLDLLEQVNETNRQNVQQTELISTQQESIDRLTELSNYAAIEPPISRQRSLQNIRSFVTGRS